MQLLGSKLLRENGKCWIIRRMKMGGKYAELYFFCKLTFDYETQGCGQFILNILSQPKHQGL